jgi:hypothetical protein
VDVHTVTQCNALLLPTEFQQAFLLVLLQWGSEDECRCCITLYCCPPAFLTSGYIIIIIILRVEWTQIFSSVTLTIIFGGLWKKFRFSEMYLHLCSAKEHHHYTHVCDLGNHPPVPCWFSFSFQQLKNWDAQLIHDKVWNVAHSF